MRLAIIGKGKTGSEVVKLAAGKHTIEIFDSQRTVSVSAIKSCDAAIVFVPPGVFSDISPILVEAKIPCVVGTTGFDFGKITGLASPWIVASNFSKGMNLLFVIAKIIDQFQVEHPELQIHLEETHHTQKKDKPSGTALYLQKLFRSRPEISAFRDGDIKGEHRLLLNLPGEKLELSHEALDRSIFASGALWAAESLLNRSPGIYQFESLFSQLLGKESL